MAPYSIYGLRPGELTGSGPRADRRTPSIFTAYRFASKESRDFRSRLQQELRKIETLADLEVTDGHVPLGKKWSTEIKDTIARARLVVADLTSLSPEVLFECGFAWGLNRPILPVVEDPEWVRRLPRWLTDLQIGHFSTEAGWKEIVDSIAENVAPLRSRRRPRRPEPIPGRVLPISPNGYLEKINEQISHVATRFDLHLVNGELLADDLGETNESLANEVSRSSLLVASLANAASDCFVHFAAGVVSANPHAGAAKRKMERRILLVVEEGVKPEDVLSESARRSHGPVRIALFKDVVNEITSYGKQYARWLASQAE